jgi:hypothetical protein
MTEPGAESPSNDVIEKLPLLHAVSRTMKEYDLRQCTGIHRELAATDTTLESIKSFADRYGLLGMTTFLTYLRDGRESYLMGERLATWRREIVSLGIMLNLWQLLQNGDIARLGQVVQWEGRDEVAINLIYRRAGASYEFSPRKRANDGFRVYGRAVLASKPWLTREHLLKEWDSRNPAPPVMFYLSERITTVLQRHTSPRLTADGNLVTTPKTLLGAIWTSLTLEVMGKSRMAQCPGCGQWFYPSTRRQQTCSDRCRVRVFRQRKAHEEVQRQDEKVAGSHPGEGEGQALRGGGITTGGSENGPQQAEVGDGPGDAPGCREETDRPAAQDRY